MYLSLVYTAGPLTIPVEEDETECHQHRVPIEGDAEGSGAPDHAALVMLHPVHSQAEQQEPNNLDTRKCGGIS